MIALRIAGALHEEIAGTLAICAAGLHDAEAKRLAAIVEEINGDLSEIIDDLRSDAFEGAQLAAELKTIARNLEICGEFVNDIGYKTFGGEFFKAGENLRALAAKIEEANL